MGDEEKEEAEVSEVRLIDANALKTRINNVPMHGDTEMFYDIMSELVSVVASAPAIDAEIVRHGRWARQIEDNGYYSCSRCGNYQMGKTDYCHDCGAKMDEVTE